MPLKTPSLWEPDGTTGIKPIGGKTTTNPGASFTDSIVINKASGKGIKVDTVSPTYGWKDLVGPIVPRTGPAASPAPAFTAFRGGAVLAYAFQAGDIIDQILFHMPHDYVPGTDMFLHHHWGHNGTAISGALAVQYSITYCKGYNQSAQTFNAPMVVTSTVTTTSTVSHPRWGHNIEEFAFTNAGGDATHIDRALMEVDGLILVSINSTTIPTITGSATSNLPYIFFLDVHYQSTQTATKDKNYPFYT